MVLLAFDVDGTLETSADPVPVSALRDLKDAGCVIVIVSPSNARPEGFTECIGGPTRRDNLEAIAEYYPCPLKLYVSDNQDRADAKAAGFTYVDAKDFHTRKGE